MPVIVVDLLTEQPLLATALQGDPNSSESMPFIPGSMLRGAWIGRYVRANGDFDSADPTVRARFFDATTCFLNAYPLSPAAGDMRTLPLPRSWRRPKSMSFSKQPDGSKRLDSVMDTAEPRPTQQSATTDVAESTGPRASTAEPEDTKMINDHGRLFVYSSGTKIMAYDPERWLNVHNARNRIIGRAIKPDPTTPGRDTGAVFRYEAIASGQRFRAAVVCAEEAIASDLYSLMPVGTVLWMGGSRSAGYGKVQVVGCSLVKTWSEVATPFDQRVPMADDGGEVWLTALSDIILRDKYGQPSLDLPAALMEQGLTGLRVEPQRSSIEINLVGGFNRTWGLPLVQTQALALGSVWVFSVAALDPATRQVLASLETQGIGERRAEGFGRLGCHWRTSSGMFSVSKPAPSPMESSTELSAASEPVATLLAERLLRQKLDACLLERVAANQCHGPISNSQLARLWSIARQSLTAQADLQAIIQFIDPENLTSQARDQLDRARVGDQSLRSWLQELVARPVTDWVPESITVAGATITVEDDNNRLAREYTLRLIMAVARQARTAREAE